MLTILFINALTTKKHWVKIRDVKFTHPFLSRKIFKIFNFLSLAKVQKWVKKTSLKYGHFKKWEGKMWLLDKGFVWVMLGKSVFEEKMIYQKRYVI